MTSDNIPANVQTILSAIMSRTGTQIITIVARTKPDFAIRKITEENPIYNKFRNIYKVATVNGILGANYERAVNKRRVQEGVSPNFITEERVWGTHVEGLPLIEYNGNAYLDFSPIKTLDCDYMFENEIIDNDLIKPYLRPKTAVKQGLDNPYKVCNYKLENVLGIKINGFYHDLIR